LVDHQEREVEFAPTKEARAFEDALKVLWDKVRAASALIGDLKSERQSIHERLTSAHVQIESLKNELQNKEQEIKRIRAELVQASNSSSSFSFSNEEKEILRDRIRELIAKINSHL